MDGIAADKGLKAQVAAAKRDYIVEPRLGNVPAVVGSSHNCTAPALVD